MIQPGDQHGAEGALGLLAPRPAHRCPMLPEPRALGRTAKSIWAAPPHGAHATGRGCGSKRQSWPEGPPSFCRLRVPGGSRDGMGRFWGKLGGALSIQFAGWWGVSAARTGLSLGLGAEPASFQVRPSLLCFQSAPPPGPRWRRDVSAGRAGALPPFRHLSLSFLKWLPQAHCAASDPSPCWAAGGLGLEKVGKAGDGQGMFSVPRRGRRWARFPLSAGGIVNGLWNGVWRGCLARGRPLRRRLCHSYRRRAMRRGLATRALTVRGQRCRPGGTYSPR